MGTISLSINNYSVEIKHFLDNKYPRLYIDPSGTFQDDSSYSPDYIWQFTCLLLPEDAFKLHRIYKEFLNRYQAQVNSDITIEDTTGIVFEIDPEIQPPPLPQTTFFGQFTKPPKYSEQGVYIQAEIELKETTTSSTLLNGSLLIATSGLSVSLLQRFMDEKFPRIWAEDSTQKLSYSVLGATIITGPAFRGKYLFNISYNATPSERVNIEDIAIAHNEAVRQRRNSPYIRVVDRTLPSLVEKSCVLVEYPKYVYNKESVGRPYKTTLALQEV